jgi:hypothetical protein
MRYWTEDLDEERFWLVGEEETGEKSILEFRGEFKYEDVGQLIDVLIGRRTVALVNRLTGDDNA